MTYRVYLPLLDVDVTQADQTVLNRADIFDINTDLRTLGGSHLIFFTS